MNEKSFSVESGGVLRDVKRVDDGFMLYVKPHENIVEIHVRQRNGSNGVHKSEAVMVYYKISRKMPNLPQIEAINSEVDDVERWEKVVREYLVAGGWQGKVDKMLDIYNGKKPPLGTPKAKEPEKVHEPLSRFYR